MKFQVGGVAPKEMDVQPEYQTILCITLAHGDFHCKYTQPDF